MNYFLVCPNCSHHNDAQSEYLTFCENCKKKLTNNFHDWQKKHPESNLSGFHIEVCIDEIEAEKLNHEAAQNRPKPPIRIFGNPKILIALAVFLVVAGLAFISINNLLNSAKKFDAISLNWERKVYGDYGLSIDCPVEAKKYKMNIPPNQSVLIEDLQAFASDPEKELSVMFISTEFNKRIGRVNVQSSISGFVTQIKSMPGISEFKVSQDETTVSGIEGFEQNGSFLNNGIPVSFKSIGVSKGLVLWQVMVVNIEDEARLEEAKERIFKSIEILYNTAI